MVQVTALRNLRKGLAVSHRSIPKKKKWRSTIIPLLSMLTLPSSNEQFGELDGQHIPRELHENNWDKKDKIGWLVKGIKSCSSGAPFLPPSDLQSPEMHSLTSGRSGEQMEGPRAMQESTAAGEGSYPRNGRPYHSTSILVAYRLILKRLA